jgi:hypothetical protein
LDSGALDDPRAPQHVTEVFGVGAPGSADVVGYLVRAVEQDRDGSFRAQREQRLGGVPGRFSGVALLPRAVGLIEGEEGPISGRGRRVGGQR